MRALFNCNIYILGNILQRLIRHCGTSEGHPTSKDIEGSICVPLCGLYVVVNLAFTFFWSAVIAYQPQAFEPTLICPRKCLLGSLPGWFTLISWHSVQMSSILRTFSEQHVLFPVTRYHVALFLSQHLLNYMTIVFAYLSINCLFSLEGNPLKGQSGLPVILRLRHIRSIEWSHY